MRDEAMNPSQQHDLLCLIFSKDRALQLQATIESFLLHCHDASGVTITVLYKASDVLHQRQYAALAERFDEVRFVAETDFRGQFLDLLRSYRHAMFLVDDNIFVRGFRVAHVLESLQRNPDAIGFSLRLGANINYSYMRNMPLPPPAWSADGQNILRFAWAGASGDFGYPLELSSSVYRTSEMLPLLGRLGFSNPNSLEGQMASAAGRFAGTHPQLLCFGRSVTFCNPVNMVQTVCSNRAGANAQYTARNLAQMFERGTSIEVARYAGFVPSGCHQEAELFFRGGGTAAAARPPEPLVSVEMAAYNAERFIGKAIESVLVQDYRNLELIVVDDGSTDATGRVVASYRDLRIRYIRQPHKNAATARNRAIQEARGECILVVDSDDMLSGGYVSAMADFVRRQADADFIYPSALTLIDEADQPTGVRWDYPDFGDNRLLTATLFRLGKSPIPNPGSMIRRSLFDRVGFYDDVDTVEDFVFLCRNAMEMRFARVEHGHPYSYRVGPGGLSRRFRQRNEVTAAALDEMVRSYPPQVLCPELVNCTDVGERDRRYLEYVMMAFYAHAQIHAGRFGEPFRQRGDHYRARLLDLPAAGAGVRSAWTMTGCERAAEMFRRATDSLKAARPDEALVYFDEVRRQGMTPGGIDYACAVAFAQLGRDDQARRLCEAELAFRPDNRGARALLERLDASAADTAQMDRTVRNGAGHNQNRIAEANV